MPEESSTGQITPRCRDIVKRINVGLVNRKAHPAEHYRHPLPFTYDRIGRRQATFHGGFGRPP